MGYTQYEKDMYLECGYHNYSEFIDDLETLLSKTYGKDHGIGISVAGAEYEQPRYKRRLRNDVVTFDVSNACPKAFILQNEADGDGKIVRDGRDMFGTFRATGGDVEECILFGAEPNLRKNLRKKKVETKDKRNY